MQQGNFEPSNIVIDTATKVMSSRTYEASNIISRGVAQNVNCSGLGLKRGFVGKENQFFVDASKAGLFLTLTIDFIAECLRKAQQPNSSVCLF